MLALHYPSSLCHPGIAKLKKKYMDRAKKTIDFCDIRKHHGWHAAWKFAKTGGHEEIIIKTMPIEETQTNVKFLSRDEFKLEKEHIEQFARTHDTSREIDWRRLEALDQSWDDIDDFAQDAEKVLGVAGLLEQHPVETTKRFIAQRQNQSWIYTYFWSWWSSNLHDAQSPEERESFGCFRSQSLRCSGNMFLLLQLTNLPTDMSCLAMKA